MGVINISQPYPKQVDFFKSKAKYTAYGGARGGGKSWAARTKAVLLAIKYAGIQILLLRRTLPELRENHVIPLQKMLLNIAKYKEQSKEFLFPNGSRIVLGYCASENDVLQYQGQAYDVIFLEEATQFTEFQFSTLTESNRSSGLCQTRFQPRMYFTCNPGGVGHYWFKRLFVDRNYKNKEKDEDYVFVQANVYENKFLMDNSPEYVNTLENLPEDRRKAMLYGDWDVFDGQYFSEFDRSVHVIKPFQIPKEWRKYLSIDYGLDMLAALWIAVDYNGNAFVYKEVYKSGLVISEAADIIKKATADEHINIRYAPPDLWNKRQETGKSAIDIFKENGLYFYKSSNNRVQGWYDLKEWLKVYEDEQGIKNSRLKIFENCTNLIRTLPALQFDSCNPNDVSSEPHELTHAPDALRGFVAGRPSRTPVKTVNTDESKSSDGTSSFLNYGI